MDEFLIALAGGIVGTLATAAWAFLARLLAARNEVRAHDQEVAEIREDLETWVADRTVELRRRVVQISELYGVPGGEGQARAFAENIAAAKEQALHEYRDEERRAHRWMIRTLDGEGWIHELWRLRRPRPNLMELGRAEPILNAWRSSVIRHGASPIAVLDPTRRGLDSALAELQASGERPYV